jgi:hypothetical protein
MIEADVRGQFGPAQLGNSAAITPRGIARAQVRSDTTDHPTRWRPPVQQPKRKDDIYRWVTGVRTTKRRYAMRHRFREQPAKIYIFLLYSPATSNSALVI